MTTAGDTTGGAALAERLAEAVRDHPSVLRLAGGEFDVITTPLPGRRVTGVRVPDSDEPVEVAVVLRLDRPLTETAADLRARAAEVAGQRRVDITVADVVTDDEAASGASGSSTGRGAEERTGEGPGNHAKTGVDGR